MHRPPAHLATSAQSYWTLCGELASKVLSEPVTEGTDYSGDRRFCLRCVVGLGPVHIVRRLSDERTLCLLPVAYVTSELVTLSSPFTPTGQHCRICRYEALPGGTTEPQRLTRLAEVSALKRTPLTLAQLVAERPAPDMCVCCWKDLPSGAATDGSALACGQERSPKCHRVVQECRKLITRTTGRAAASVLEEVARV